MLSVAREEVADASVRHIGSRAPAGGMLSVALPVAELEPLLGERLFIAAINTPELCVVSGSPSDIDALEQQLHAQDVATTRVRIAVAAHSALLDSRAAPCPTCRNGAR